MRFRLIAGDYVGPDCSGKSGKKDKETGRFPLKSFTPGEVVHSDEDLAKRFGRNKFEPMDHEKGGKDEEELSAPASAATSPAVAPGGQVSSGHQETTSKEDRTPVSGAKDIDLKPVQPAIGPSSEESNEGEDEDGGAANRLKKSGPTTSTASHSHLSHPPAPKASEHAGTTHPGKGETKGTTKR